MSLATQRLTVVDLGLVPYEEAWDLQRRMAAQRAAGVLGDTLLLLEHPHTYTFGSSGKREHLLVPEAELREQGVAVLDVDRGGDVTYHGPGQLVGYPIMHIDDVLVYVRTMERAIIAALRDLGVEGQARRGKDLTGVWVQDRKIASIGVHIARGVTTHGFAVNVDNDLDPFDWVVPCGLPDVRMTSVRAETGRAASFAAFRERMAERFCDAYGRIPGTLELDAAAA